MPDLASLATEEGLDIRESSLSLMEWRQEEMKAFMALEVQGVGTDQFGGTESVIHGWLIPHE